MGAGGFFNHYDDPDEFWDEAPMKPVPGTVPARTSPPHAGPSTARPVQRDVASYRASPASEPIPAASSPMSPPHSGLGDRSLIPGSSGATRSIENLIDDLSRGSSYNGTFPDDAQGNPGWPDSLAGTFADASVEGDGESKWRLN